MLNDIKFRENSSIYTVLVSCIEMLTFEKSSRLRKCLDSFASEFDFCTPFEVLPFLPAALASNGFSSFDSKAFLFPYSLSPILSGAYKAVEGLSTEADIGRFSFRTETG